MSLLMEALRKAEEEKEKQPEEGSVHPQQEASEEQDSLLVLDLPDLADAAPEAVIFEPVPEPASENETETGAQQAALRELPPARGEHRAKVGKPEPSSPLEAELEAEAEAPAEIEAEQQMAKALFHARARTRTRRRWLALLMVLALVCLAVLVSWYLLVARVEQGVLPVDAVPPAASDGGDAGFAPPPVAGDVKSTEPAEAAPVTERDGGEGVLQAPGEELVAPQQAKVIRKQETPAATRHQLQPPARRNRPARIPAKPATAENAAPVAAPMTAEAVYRRAMDRMAGGQTRNPAIQIRRSTRKRGGGASPVHEAWQAFREGRYREADERYATVLAKEPFNRDALLGRAAVAVAMGKPRLAQDFYLRLLERDPRDPLAQAGMVALQGRRQPVEAIARVQQLIATNPDLGGLNFILGNLYAAQERWAYAQQAYFKAHVSDPGNPDYLFNLAVSLDHLGKGRQALEFYRRALQQARQRKSRFQEEVVSRRIQALSAVENSP
jgi:tetratricopeptide (TPR) repeat protein